MSNAGANEVCTHNNECACNCKEVDEEAGDAPIMNVKDDYAYLNDYGYEDLLIEFVRLSDIVVEAGKRIEALRKRIAIRVGKDIE